MHNPTTRFSNRVADYVKYRPRYPEAVLDVFAEAMGFSPSWVVADVGSGTGIFAELLLKHGNSVIAIEPNKEMREAAEQSLWGYSKFRSVPGSAEATTLPAQSVDLVTAAQAFHWFDASMARAEFVRILKPAGWVALVWNDRKIDATPFLAAYEALVSRASGDYAAVNHRNVDAQRLRTFFGGDYREATLPNEQHFDWDGIYGRAMSSSYIPAEGHVNHPAFVKALREIFDRYEENGRVTFEYDTRIYLVVLAPLC